MRVLIAGATGAIGRPLIRCLNQNRHTVYALARSPTSAHVVTELGAEPVTADALDAGSVESGNNPGAAGCRHQRADLAAQPLYGCGNAGGRRTRPHRSGSREMSACLRALRDAGVRRYVLQSGGFWYAPGDGLADESAPFAFDASPAVAAGSRRYAELEATATGTPGIEFVALRYGFFYGPGTWFRRDGDMGEQAREQRVPVIGDGQGVWSWVHIEDAAAATAAALECRPGAYNVVDADPTPQRVWLPAFARAVGAPAPPQITEEEALAAFGPDTVYYADAAARRLERESETRTQFSAAPARMAAPKPPDALTPPAVAGPSLARALLKKFSGPTFSGYCRGGMRRPFCPQLQYFL